MIFIVTLTSDMFPHEYVIDFGERIVDVPEAPDNLRVEYADGSLTDYHKEEYKAYETTELPEIQKPFYWIYDNGALVQNPDYIETETPPDNPPDADIAALKEELNEVKEIVYTMAGGDVNDNQ